jgi:hypothetical protein
MASTGDGMSYASLLRGTLAGMLADQKLAATISDGSRTTAAVVLDGVVDPEHRRYEGSTVVTGGVRELAVMADGLDFAPVIGMVLTVGGIPWSVLDVGVMEPTDNGAPVLYRLAAAR